MTIAAKSAIEIEFEQDPLSFMEKYAVYPGGDYVQNDPNLYDKPTAGLALDDRLTIDRRLKMLGYAKLTPTKSMGATRKNAYNIDFYTAAHAGTDTPKCIPVWFLPWHSNAITSITLPAKLPALPSVPNPAPNAAPAPPPIPAALLPDTAIFFTAAINGCSVFVHGDPKAPTICHAGTNDQRSRDAFEITRNYKDGKVVGKSHTLKDDFFPTGNPRTHWTDVFEKEFGTTGTAANVKSIHTQDYKNYMSTGNSAVAIESEKFLRDNSGKYLQIDSVQSSGCVFGLRDAAGNWSFYLQKKIEISVTKLHKEKQLFGANQYVPNMVPVPGAKVAYKSKPWWGGEEKTKQRQRMAAESYLISIPAHTMKFFPGKGTANGGTARLDNNTLKMRLQSLA